MMNKIKTNLLPFLAIATFQFFTVSCQNRNQKEFVEFVIQPEVEIGKSFDVNIQFLQNPDSLISSSNQIKGLTLIDNFDKFLGKISESELTDDDGKVIKKFYSFNTYATPNKLGRIDFPTLTVIFKGKEYKTKAFFITVVDKIKIDEKNAVKLIWSADKTDYNLKDTIKLNLYQYAKFSQVVRRHLPPKNVSLNGKENQINIGVEETMDGIVGMDGFEKIMYQNFELTDVDWNMLGSRKSMEKVGDELYIKTLILELKLLAKTKQTFNVGPSEFDFSIYKSNTDYFSGFQKNEEGSYNITDNGSKQLKIKSNKLTIQVD
ncbi:hypothetical protein [Flavobacterium tegetincola]|uniref:hypothetical protein n=1 Tax=Flavobacterium tegetincola TaxID=150172 RepID=UPI00042673C8|nr:hypothetical protein [Flavobacterium tegetincola]